MVFISICSRKDSQPYSLKELEGWANRNNIPLRVAYDSSSIYNGHKENLEYFTNFLMASDEQFVLFCHDDVEFLFDGGILERVLEDYSKDSKLGFIGAAGAWELGKDAIWWNARRIGKSSGFVFQGKDIKTMVPNYFGMYRNVVALDGCFFGAKLGVIKTIGLDKPGYLTSDWDFYDIHMTVSAHLKGYNNYAVPLIIKHESSGEMRDQWYKSRDEFISRHKQYLPLSVGRIG